MNRHTENLLLTAAAGTLAFYAGKQLVRNGRRLAPRNKTVLITGGSRGLGLVLAREFSRLGARVAVCARHEDDLQAVWDEFAGRNEYVLPVACDVTKRDQVEQLVAVVEDRAGPVDILVNNAGTITVGPFETMTEEDYREALDLHLWAPLYTSLAVLPSMRERGFGRIVNISSIGGKVPVPHLAPYCASKFALTGLSECMRGELAKDNIFVTTVCPGLMRTGSPRNVNVKGRYAEEYTWFILGDSLPGMSMSARRAARKIVDAALHGDAEVILSLPAKAATWLHGIAPALTSELLQLQSALLPDRPVNWDSGEGIRKRRGYESETAVTRSFVTALTREAAEENNELYGHPNP